MPLFPIAIKALTVWPQWFAAAGLDNEKVWFPSHAYYRDKAKLAQRQRHTTGTRRKPDVAHASQAAVFRGIQSMLEAAGIPKGQRYSPQALRNAYAARLFANGKNDAEVAAAMGLNLTVSATRLRQALMKYLATIDSSASYRTIGT